MSKCPSFFGKCDPDATYDADDANNMFAECLQQCTPKPCSSNLNNILSNCTQYLTNENLMMTDDASDQRPPPVVDLCENLFHTQNGVYNPGINLLNTELDNFPPGIFVADDSSVCKASYTGKNSPIFQKNVDYACKNHTSYPITSTLYPKCSSYLNNLWTKCSNITHTPIPAICDELMFDDSGVTLPPQANKPPTYCAAMGIVDAPGWAMINQETGEYIGNMIACGGKHPMDDDPEPSICLAQYNDTPSKAFCNEFESSPSPSPKKGLSTGAIVGIIIGSLVLLLIIGVVLKRKRSR